MILMPVQLFSQVPESRYDFHFDNILFGEFADSVFDRSGVRIYSDEKLTGDLRISIDEDSMTVYNAVVECLDGSGLKVSRWNDDIIVSTIKLISDLPSYNRQILPIRFPQLKSLLSLIDPDSLRPEVRNYQERSQSENGMQIPGGAF